MLRKIIITLSLLIAALVCSHATPSTSEGQTTRERKLEIKGSLPDAGLRSSDYIEMYIGTTGLEILFLGEISVVNVEVIKGGTTVVYQQTVDTFYTEGIIIPISGWTSGSYRLNIHLEINGDTWYSDFTL